MQKSHFPNAYPINGRMAMLLPWRNMRFDTFFFLKSQLSMCWKVAISCEAYEVGGTCTVVFLIPLRTENAIYTPAWTWGFGAGAGALQGSREKADRAFLRSSAGRESGESLMAALLTPNHLLAVVEWRSLVRQEMAAAPWAEEVHRWEQGEGLGLWSPSPGTGGVEFNRGKAGDHTGSLETWSISPPFCPFMPVRCLLHGHFICDTPIHIGILQFCKTHLKCQ